MVSTCKQRGLVERRRDDAIQLTRKCERYSALYSAAGESSRVGSIATGPRAGSFVDVDSRATRADKNKIGGVAHYARRRRLFDDLRTDAANVAERDA
jgi:hypothetical protein